MNVQGSCLRRLRKAVGNDLVLMSPHSETISSSLPTKSIGGRLEGEPFQPTAGPPPRLSRRCGCPALRTSPMRWLWLASEASVHGSA